MPFTGLVTSSQPQQHTPGPRASGAPLLCGAHSPEPAGRPHTLTWSKRPQRHGAPPKSPAERPRRRPPRPRPAHLAQTRHRLDLDRPAAASITSAHPTATRTPTPPRAATYLGYFSVGAVFSANQKTRYDAHANYSKNFFRPVFSAKSKSRYDARANYSKSFGPFFQRPENSAMMRAQATREVFPAARETRHDAHTNTPELPFFQRLPKPAMMRARASQKHVAYPLGTCYDCTDVAGSSRLEANDG